MTRLPEPRLYQSRTGLIQRILSLTHSCETAAGMYCNHLMNNRPVGGRSSKTVSPHRHEQPVHWRDDWMDTTVVLDLMTGNNSNAPDETRQQPQVFGPSLH
jgi:hypothetical protein